MALEKEDLPRVRDMSREEFQVLGIILQHPQTLDEVADQLEPRHFQNPQAQIIFALILEQYQQEQQVSRTKLFLRLKEDNIVPNPDEVVEALTEGFTTPSELKPAIDIIREAYQKRLLIKAAHQIEQLALTSQSEQKELQARAQELIFAATMNESSLDRHTFTMEEALINAYEAYMERKNNRGDIGLPTGYISLDKLIGGFKRGHLNVIAASTSMGKTAFAINVAKNILKRKVPVALISLEMDAREIIDRMIIQEAGVHGWRYSQGQTTEDEEERILEALDMLHDLPLLISDERGLNAAQIRARLRKFKAQMDGELGLAVIDYLQMIRLPQEGFNASNTARAVGDVVLQLRNLASELEVPILLISQISRSFKSRQDKRPVLSDLRDSGNIEEIADGVIFLYRHAHTSIAAREEARSKGVENEAEIIVAKQRTGQTGSTKLLFEEEFVRFVDPENLSLEESMPYEG
ncbi:MAG: DnaB-like helicase C-terminal domain-containing protein [Halanaerobium sp.]|nr:DnaB-like helicase C-terminal domain-containing protein [Halanaerobium sp.]